MPIGGCSAGGGRPGEPSGSDGVAGTMATRGMPPSGAPPVGGALWSSCCFSSHVISPSKPWSRPHSASPAATLSVPGARNAPTTEAPTTVPASTVTTSMTSCNRRQRRRLARLRSSRWLSAAARVDVEIITFLLNPDPPLNHPPERHLNARLAAGIDRPCAGESDTRYVKVRHAVRVRATHRACGDGHAGGGTIAWVCRPRRGGIRRLPQTDTTNRSTARTVLEMADTRRLPKPVAHEWDWQLKGSCQGLNSSIFF